jgi:hypothetical protein
MQAHDHDGGAVSLEATKSWRFLWRAVGGGDGQGKAEPRTIIYSHDELIGEAALTDSEKRGTVGISRVARPRKGEGLTKLAHASVTKGERVVKLCV